MPALFKAKAFILSLLAATLLLFFLALGFVFSLHGSGPLTENRYIIIERGTGVSGIAQKLEQENAISSAPLFRIGYYLYYYSDPLMAGEYLIEASSSAAHILQKMATGDVNRRVVTVPEGWSSAQVAEVLNNTEGLTGEIIEAIPEGSVLPETYQFTFGETRQEVLARMQKAFKEVAEPLWQNRAEGLPFDTLKQAIALASVVEKETGIAEERPRIAAVFINRLEKGMPLQSDPTVIYGITKGLPLGRKLWRGDIKRTQSPYNTYLNRGIPPGPICNPGKDSLAAVLNPPDTKELYFVADGTGGHIFAETLQEHNRNAAKWRKIRKEREREEKQKENEATKNQP